MEEQLSLLFSFDSFLFVSTFCYPNYQLLVSALLNSGKAEETEAFCHRHDAGEVEGFCTQGGPEVFCLVSGGMPVGCFPAWAHVAEAVFFPSRPEGSIRSDSGL